ncbi:MAG: NADH-quinone oxidoreductase, chain [Pseudomonadota bacterium]|jgi:NADH-quinone oxidoreductase subunit H
MSLEILAPWLAVVAKCVFSLAFVMNIVPLLIWAERKGAAYIQDRPGPNRASILGIRAGGLVHTLNDVVKLIMKEDIVPGHVEGGYWATAPVISMTVALCTFAVVPFGDHLTIPIDGKTFEVALQVSGIDGGLLFVLAMTGIGVYGVMLAGWASNNKFSLLGGLRASAQMVSYELAMGLSAVVVFVMSGSVSLAEIARQQSGAIWHWNVFSPPGFIAFVLFWVAAFAETNRTPFDLPEGEAELVGGYHTEYSSLRFALFFMAEYANMIVASAVTATLFFGGYNVPFLDGAALRANADMLLTVAGFGAVPAFLFFAAVAWKRRNRPFYKEIPANDPRQREPLVFTVIWIGAALAHAAIGVLGLTGFVGASALGPELVAFVAQLSALAVKILAGCWVFIWVRWTVPRFRYDQLMDLGWKMMLPAALANVFLASLWVIAKQTFFA